MKISEKMHSELYRSISDPIIELRVRLAMGDAEDMNKELFALEGRIYEGIRKSLGLEK